MTNHTDATAKYANYENKKSKFQQPKIKKCLLRWLAGDGRGQEVGNLGTLVEEITLMVRMELEQYV